MEIMSKTPFNSSIKRYWRRREYKRLHAEIADRRRVQVTRFGRGNPRRRFWKIRVIPKLRWRILSSPLKLLLRLKNAYVRMMFSLAGNVGSLNTNHVFGSKRIPKARQAPEVYSADEIENRLVYEIYMALKASRDLGAAPKL